MSRYRSQQQTNDFQVLLDTLAFFPSEFVQQAYNAMKPLATHDPNMARYHGIQRKGMDRVPRRIYEWACSKSEIPGTEVRNI